MSVRLRYLAHDLEIPNGEFVIGRTPECQLSLDDPLVSRKHAVLTVQRDGVFLHDIGSRNGVFVNGRRVVDTTRIVDGDIVKIGHQEMTIQGVELHVRSRPPSSSRVQTMRDLRPLTPPGEIDVRDALPHDDAGVPDSSRELRLPELALQDLDSAPTSSDRDFDEVTDVTGIGGRSLKPASRPDKRVTALGIIGNVADKALALGNVDEAERILTRPLADVRTRAEQGEAVDHAVAEQAVSYAVRLAAATGKGVHIDYVFAVYAALAMVLPAKVVEDLYAAVRKVKHADRATLMRYESVLRDIEPTLRPAERFLQQRIGGLEHWIP